MVVGGGRLACREFGDAGLLIDVLDDDAGQQWSRARALGEALRASGPSGLVDVVAAFTGVFVSFDPLLTDHRTVEALVHDLAGHAPPPAAARRFVVPVVYGGQAGPDLEATAELLGLCPDALVELHSGADWVVRFVGSPAGAPLMDGPRLPASVPRLAVPRPRVAIGSIGVSGFQGIVYNAASPGGWQLLGRTPATLFDLDHPPHVAYQPGDRLRFRPIEADDWGRWAGHLLEPEVRAP